MKIHNLISIILISIFLSGCSLIPRLTFDSPGTVPESITKGKDKEICRGKAEWNNMGNITSCSKGYYQYGENYNKKERKMTIVEKVKSFINNILGWGIPGLLIICVLFPGAFTIIGAFIGRLIEGSFGIAKQALSATVRGVQRSRKQGEDINIALSDEQDQKIKKYIRELKEKEKIK